MLIHMEGAIDFGFPSDVDENLLTIQKNISLLIGSDLETISTQPDPDYEQFLADVWVGIILTLIVLSCVCCMCSCLLYHKFQQWKRQILAATHSANLENGTAENESLPSYTIVSGLPSYDEALEQLKKVQELRKTSRGLDNVGEGWIPHTPPTPHMPIAKLSVTDLFQLYKNTSTSTSTLPISELALKV